MDRGRGQRQRVRPSAARHDEASTRLEVGETAAYGVTHGRERRVQAHGRTRLTTRGRGRPRSRGRGSRPGWGRLSASAHTALKSAMPTLSTTARTNLAPSRYCAIFASSPSSLRSSRSSVPDALAALVELAADRLHARDHRRPDAVHDVVGVALEQRHHPGDPVEDLLLLRRAQQVEQAAAALAVLDRLGDALEPLVEEALRLDGVGQGVELGEEVVAHPRHGGELDPVGLLVQADPEPEVVRVGVQLALDVDDVRSDEQQPAVRARGTGRTDRAPCWP